MDTTHHGWADAQLIEGNTNLSNEKEDKLHLNTLMMIM